MSNDEFTLMKQALFDAIAERDTALREAVKGE